MASIRETFNNWLVFYLLISLSWLAVLVMGVAETFSDDIAFMTIVKEICSNKNSTLRKENRGLEESLSKAKKGISQIIKRYKN